MRLNLRKTTVIQKMISISVHCLVRRTLLSALLLLSISAGVYSSTEKVFDVDIPAMPLFKALTRLSEQTDTDVLFSFEMVEGKRSRAVKGSYTLTQALGKLLQDTELVGGLSEKGVVTIQVRTLINNNNGEDVMNHKKSLLASLIGGLLGAAGVQYAVAEEAGSTAGRKMSAIEEVVVTARKRGAAESAQEVPIAITAVNGDLIEKRFLKDLTDVGMTIPNVSLNAVGTMPGTANFFIRGMGVFGSIPSDETTVGVILDGIYLGVNSGALSTLFDVEAVEVLRGPQGTLFGRNVTGGAIVVNSRRPTQEFDAKIQAGVGNEGKYKLDGAVGGAITDTVSGRLVAGYMTHDDYFDNVAGPDRGEEDSFYIRPSVMFEPTDDLTVTLIGEYQDWEGDGVISKNLALTTGPNALDDFEVANDLDAKAEYQTKQLVADVDWQLGEGNLRVIAGWRDTNNESELDADGMAVTLVHSNMPWVTEQDQVSLEVRYFTPITSIWDATMGLYYFDQDIVYKESRTLSSGDVGAGGLMDHNSWAAFTQSDIRVTDNWTLTAGIRYTYEEKEAKVASFPDKDNPAYTECDGDGENCNYTFDEKKDWGFISYYAGSKYQLTDSTHTYLSWTRSFRSGGYNLRNTLPNNPPGPYDEEQVNAWEWGLKSQWFDNRLRMNVALFNNKYSDLQRTIISGASGNIVQVKENAASATIQGAELELTAYLTDNFRVEASAGWVDAEYDKFEGGNPELDFANVPEKSGSLTMAYSAPMQNGGLLDMRMTTSYTGEQWATDPNDLQLKSYTLYDASAGYTLPGDNTRISVYGKNLSNKEYTNFALQGLNTLWGIAPPRTYGIEVTHNF